MLKVIGWLALAGFAVVAFWLFNFQVVSPWLYERTTRAANAANDAYWADGIARIYKLEARIEVEGETFTATSELTCAPKSFTRPPTIEDRRVYRRGTGWDGHWLNVWRFKADPLSIHLPDGSRFDFPYNGREACQRLPRTSLPRDFPSPLEGIALFVYVEVAGPQGGLCKVSVSKGPAAIGASTIFPVSAVSMREVRLRDVLSRGAYGEAGDRYPRSLVEHPRDTSSRLLGNWDRERSCWSKGADRGPADCPWGGQPACPLDVVDPTTSSE